MVATGKLVDRPLALGALLRDLLDLCLGRFVLLHLRLVLLVIVGARNARMPLDTVARAVLSFTLMAGEFGAVRRRDVELAGPALGFKAPDEFWFFLECRSGRQRVISASPG